MILVVLGKKKTGETIVLSLLKSNPELTQPGSDSLDHLTEAKAKLSKVAIVPVIHLGCVDN